LASGPAHAQFGALTDILKTKSESKTVIAVYDLPGVRDGKPIRDMVYQALTYQGDNAKIVDGVVRGEAPRVPGAMAFKEMSIGPLTIQFPRCEGSVFSVSSSDGSMAQWGDSANYMACGFRYDGGYRVSFYAQSQSTSGGAFGLLSGKTIGKALAGAVGLSSDPMKFVDSSLEKLESLMKEAGLSYTLVEMTPILGQRQVAGDPLAKERASSEKRATDRSKRLAARTELTKLGIDASDASRFIRAVQSGDEDVVGLFVEAGAIDFGVADASGKLPIEYAVKPSIRELLAAH
jgi:hypothetical protein